MGALHPQELLRDPQRHPQRDVVEGLAVGGEQPSHPHLDRVDPAGAGVREEHDLIAGLDAEVGGESLPHDDAARVVGRQPLALRHDDCGAERLLLLRIDPLAGEGKRRLAEADEPAEGEARGDCPHARNLLDRFALGRALRQQEAKRIGGARLQVALAHHLDVTDPRPDHALAHRPVHPLDEPGGEDERDDPERHRDHAHHAAPALARDVAEREPHVLRERSCPLDRQHRLRRERGLVGGIGRCGAYSIGRRTRALARARRACAGFVRDPGKQL